MHLHLHMLNCGAEWARVLLMPVGQGGPACIASIAPRSLASGAAYAALAPGKLIYCGKRLPIDSNHLHYSCSKLIYHCKILLNNLLP